MACCDLATGKRLHYIPKLRSDALVAGKGKGKAKMVADDAAGHTDEVLTLALSGDGKYLVSGGQDRRVCVWDISEDENQKNSQESISYVKAFSGHKDTIVVGACFYVAKESKDSLLHRACRSENLQTICILLPLTEPFEYLIYLPASWVM
jgi:WD40 repeat protein